MRAFARSDLSRGPDTSAETLRERVERGHEALFRRRRPGVCGRGEPERGGSGEWAARVCRKAEKAVSVVPVGLDRARQRLPEEHERLLPSFRGSDGGKPGERALP